MCIRDSDSIVPSRRVARRERRRDERMQAEQRARSRVDELLAPVRAAAEDRKSRRASWTKQVDDSAEAMMDAWSRDNPNADEIPEEAVREIYERRRKRMDPSLNRC